PIGWTPDSKAVLFISNRENGWAIYAQKLGASISERLATDVSQNESIGVSYDSIYYFHSEPSVPDTPSHLMRIPISGWTPQEVLRGQIRGVGCGWSQGTRCVISELTSDKMAIIFSVLDPIKGRGPELARFHDEQAEGLYWQLSSDGNRIALVRELESRI